jgi:uncharacterized cupin superfamily protein
LDLTRVTDAPAYEPPRHHHVTALRLQGFDVSPTKTFWVGLSRYEPGGSAERDASATDKVYVVVEGEITVITNDGETVLGPLDSCHFARGEARAVENRSSRPASMLVLIEYPPDPVPSEESR